MSDTPRTDAVRRHVKECVSPGDLWDALEKMTETARALEREAAALAQFKEFVHAYLTRRGVPVDPPGEHRDAGCRIGQRLQYLCDDRDRTKAEELRLWLMILDVRDEMQGQIDRIESEV